MTALDEAPAPLAETHEPLAKTFGEPIRVDEGTPLGRVDAMLLDDGAALVVWLETTARGAEVRARRVRPDGEASVPATVALTDVSGACQRIGLVHLDIRAL